MEQILIIIGIVIIYGSIVYFGSKAIGNQIYRYQKLNKDIEFLEKLENDQINDIRMNNRRFLDKLPDKWEPLSKSKKNKIVNYGKEKQETTRGNFK